MSNLEQKFKLEKKRIETAIQALSVLEELECTVGIIGINTDKKSLELLSNYFNEPIDGRGNNAFFEILCGKKGNLTLQIGVEITPNESTDKYLISVEKSFGGIKKGKKITASKN